MTVCCSRWTKVTLSKIDLKAKLNNREYLVVDSMEIITYNPAGKTELRINCDNFKVRVVRKAL